jgi:hypothetical protein
MWDCTGLECLIDITDLDHDMMMASLKGEEFKAPFSLSMMLLRGQVNPQRNYEIYTFEVDFHVTKKQLESLFADNPQGMVDLVRQQGHKIYSNASKKKPVII